MSKFKFPPIYQFPPFWTIQPAMESCRKQTESWCELILLYCKANNINTLKVKDAIKTPLFKNDSIKRSLDEKTAEFFLDQLVQRSNAEWMDEKHQKCKIIWRKAPQWGQLMYNWAHSNNSENVVFTLYELRESEGTQGEAFHMMDQSQMKEAIQYLVSKKQAVFYDAKEFDECGVKFL